jgi:hypothetical protein
MKDHLPYVVQVSVPAGGLGKRIEEMQSFYERHWLTARPTTSYRENHRDYVRWYFADEETAKKFSSEFDGQLIEKPAED